MTAAVPTPRRRRWLWPAAAALALFVAAAVVWLQLRPAYSSPFVDATWHPADPAGRVTGRLLRWNGSPEPGKPVQVTADDGTVAAATTDADGRFSVPLARPPAALAVVGVDTVPLARWTRPAADHGTAFTLRLKRPAPPSKGPL